MEKLNQHHDKKGQEDLPAPSGATFISGNLRNSQTTLQSYHLRWKKMAEWRRTQEKAMKIYNIIYQKIEEQHNMDTYSNINLFNHNKSYCELSKF